MLALQLGLCNAVADWLRPDKVLLIPANPKEQDQARSLAKLLGKLHTELEHACKLNAEADLAKTAIASTASKAALQQRTVMFRNRVLAIGGKRLTEAWGHRGTCEKLLAALPEPSANEPEYQKQALGVLKDLAAAASGGSEALDQVKTLAEDLNFLGTVNFQGSDSGAAPGLSFEGTGGDAEGFKKACAQTFAVSQAHVGLTALLCLLRSPAVGAASEVGKDLLGKLAGVRDTLVKQLEALAPHTEHSPAAAALHTYGSNTCKEAGELLSGKSEANAGDAQKGPKRKADKQDETEKPAKEAKRSKAQGSAKAASKAGAKSQKAKAQEKEKGQVSEGKRKT